MTNNKNRHLKQSQMLHFWWMGYGIMTDSLQNYINVEVLHVIHYS